MWQLSSNLSEEFPINLTIRYITETQLALIWLNNQGAHCITVMLKLLSFYHIKNLIIIEALKLK